MHDERISFIGAGRVGRALAGQFHKKDLQIATVIDIDPEKARLCQKECQARESASDIRQLSPSTSILFITVPDDEIHNVAEELSQQWQPDPGMVITHTSGLLGSDILSPLSSAGIYLNSMHPCFSFMGDENSMQDVYFALEGHEKGFKKLASLVSILGGRPFPIRPDEKPLYHTACTIASNYLVSLLAYARDVMGELEIEDEIDCLMPLIRSTLANISKKGVDSALTGPILRGDAGTVETHLISLHQKNPQWIPPYLDLGKWALKIAGDTDTDPGKLERIRTILSQYPKELND